METIIFHIISRFHLEDQEKPASLIALNYAKSVVLVSQAALDTVRSTAFPLTLSIRATISSPLVRSHLYHIPHSITLFKLMLFH